MTDHEPDDYDNANVFNIMCEATEQQFNEEITFIQKSTTHWMVCCGGAEEIGIILYKPKTANYKAIWMTNDDVHGETFWSLDDAQKAILLSYGQ